MKARKELELQNRCNSQSNQRLNGYRRRLLKDDTRVIFDDKVHDLVEEYALDKQFVQETKDYLDNLICDDGIRFGRSVKTSALLQKHFDHFLQPDVPTFVWNQHFQYALRKVTARYREARQNPLNYSSSEEIMDCFPKLSASSGFTGIITGKMHKEDFVGENVLKVYQDELAKALKVGSFERFSLLSVRTQCSGELTEEGVKTWEAKHKTRPVWMVDFIQLMFENQFALPVTKFLRNYKFSNACNTDEDTSRRLFQMKVFNTFWLSIDYSAYDSTQPAWLLHQAFVVLRACFKHLTELESRILEIIEEDYIRKNVITGDGVLYIQHGTPSGSALTTIINGIVNELITETWAHKFGVEVDYCIQGDDNIIFSNHEIDLEQVASYITKNFGIIVHPSKCTSGNRRSNPHPSFLSRIWKPEGPYRHPAILLSKLDFPERFRDHSKCPAYLVIYSYILGYAAGMKELIDVNRFLSDFKLKLKKVNPNDPMFREIPYNVQMSVLDSLSKTGDNVRWWPVSIAA